MYQKALEVLVDKAKSVRVTSVIPLQKHTFYLDYTESGSQR